MKNNNNVARVLVPNVGSTGRYEIRLGADSRVYCTCPAWKFSGDAKDCKHLRQHGFVSLKLAK